MADDEEEYTVLQSIGCYSVVFLYDGYILSMKYCFFSMDGVDKVYGFVIVHNNLKIHMKRLSSTYI